MEKVINPHDKFVRETLSRKETARDFFGHYLPEDLVRMIDLDSLEIQKDTFIEENLKASYSDLLYRVSLNNQVGFLYLLFEHKSREDRFVALQLLGYILNIWNQHLKQTKDKLVPVVIPMVLFHGRKEWTSGTNLVHLISGQNEQFQKFIPDFEFLLCDLTRYSDDEIKGSIFSKAFLLLLKYILFPDFPRKLPAILRLLVELESRPTGLKSLETFLTYIFSAADNLSIEQFKDIMESTEQAKAGGSIMTLAEQYYESGKRDGILLGKQEGRQEGRQEGELNGILTSLELVLTMKFGDGAAKFMTDLKRIKDVDLLKDIFRRIHSAESLSDVEKILEK